MSIAVLTSIVVILVLLVVLSDILAAVIPLVIVLTCVPERDRDSLARVLAVIDSSRRLRIWPALRLAVALRRQEIRHARASRDPRANPYAHLEAHFAEFPGDVPVNPPYDRPMSPPVPSRD